MCKIDLKDYSVPLRLCFGLRPGPRILQNFFSDNITPIFLDDILITAASIEELTSAQDTLLYLIQGLGFLINI